MRPPYPLPPARPYMPVEAPSWMPQAPCITQLGEMVADDGNGPTVAFCRSSAGLAESDYLAGLSFREIRQRGAQMALASETLAPFTKITHTESMTELQFLVSGWLTRPAQARQRMTGQIETLLPENRGRAVTLGRLADTWEALTAAWRTPSITFVLRLILPPGLEGWRVHLDHTRHTAITYLTPEETTAHVAPDYAYRLKFVKESTGQYASPSRDIRQHHMGMPPRLSTSAWRGEQLKRPSAHCGQGSRYGPKLILLGSDFGY